jgi:hypothetical protein
LGRPVQQRELDQSERERPTLAARLPAMLQLLPLQQAKAAFDEK